MVSISSQRRQVASGAILDLKAFLRVQTVLFRVWKINSFVLEGRRGRERIL
jgi:hypothetical protein